MTSHSILLPELGAPFEGGRYGGTVRIGVHLFAFAWAPKALGESRAIWLPEYTDVPGATSCVDSVANTHALAEAGSPLAQWALALDIDGKRDWVVAARDLVELGYRHLKPTAQENYCTFRDGDNPSSVPPGYPYTSQAPAQTSVADFRAGGPEAFEADHYWASTQYSESSAWGQDFDYGGQ
ncbi:unnamed protein product, partial [Phaeothamnion confervicola]